MTNSAVVSILKVLASASTLMMFLSPGPDVYQIYTTRVIGEVSILPLVSLWASTHSWMMYGLLSGDIFPIFLTCVVGQVVALVFLSVYYIHTPDKAYACKAIGAVACFVLLITAYAILGRIGATNQSHYQVGQTVGYISNCVSLILNASPFETIKRVVKTKSASSLPILLCVAGATSNSIWVAYGLAVRDLVVAIPNGICAAFGLTQVTLYLVYHPHRSTSSKLQLIPVSATTAPTAAAAPGETLVEIECAGGFKAIRSPCVAS